MKVEGISATVLAGRLFLLGDLGCCGVLEVRLSALRQLRTAVLCRISVLAAVGINPVIGCWFI